MPFLNSLMERPSGGAGHCPHAAAPSARPPAPSAHPPIHVGSGTSAAAITGAKTTSATKTVTNPARRRGMAALSSRSIGCGQMWIAWPSAPSVASSAASDRVGWAWIVWMISSSVASSVRPTANSWMISVASGPTMCTPRISPDALSATTFTKPSVSPRATALPFAVNGNLPMLTSRPASPNAERLQPEPRHLRSAADGHERLLGFDLAGVGFDDHARAPRRHRGHFHAGLHLDGPAPERPRELLRDLLVLNGHKAGQRLEDRHVGTVGGVDIGELDADRAGADHNDGLGRPLAPHGAVGGDHRLLVDRDAGQRLRLGARGEDHRLGLDRLGPTCPRHLHGVARLEDAATRDERDLVLPEQELDALRHAVGDAAAPLDRLRVVRLEACEPDAELRGALEEVHDLGVAQERLGRDAAPVQADAAGPVVLDGRHRKTELRAADRGDVTPRSRADDGDVGVVRGHRSTPGAAAAPPAGA